MTPERIVGNVSMPSNGDAREYLARKTDEEFLNFLIEAFAVEYYKDKAFGGIAVMAIHEEAEKRLVKWSADANDAGKILRATPMVVVVIEKSTRQALLFSDVNFPMSDVIRIVRAKDPLGRNWRVRATVENLERDEEDIKVHPLDKDHHKIKWGLEC